MLKPTGGKTPPLHKGNPSKSCMLSIIINYLYFTLLLRLFMCETLAKRVVGMVLAATGLPDNHIAELTGLCNKSVKALRKGLEDGEFGNMFHVAGGGWKRKLADFEGSIVEEINNGAFHSHQQIADIYQKCAVVAELVIQLDIHLVFIPPYSPNLNLIERLWKHIKSKLRTKYYDVFDDFKTRIDSIVSDNVFMVWYILQPVSNQLRHI
jgi:hypothetical protein